MEPERWQQVGPRPRRGHRDALLRDAGDDSLRREVETMLGYAKETHGSLMRATGAYAPNNSCEISRCSRFTSA
jgi:hypothetical protein